MKNSKAVFSEIIAAIHLNEPREEKEGIARILIEEYFGLTLTSLMSNEPLTITENQTIALDNALTRLNAGEPVQYVIEKADFFGQKFYVNKNVLIPRPETEELVSEVIAFVQENDRSKSARILDIGTGSGCIPVTLASIFPQAEIYASDVSADALDVARKNADLHHVSVSFLVHDILRSDLPLSDLDVVISNPPYIAESEKIEMKNNVVAFEPHLALFVPNEDPLIFYERISDQAKSLLKEDGLLIFEINERYGDQVARLMQNKGFKEVTIIKDLSGKQRIVKGRTGID